MQHKGPIHHPEYVFSIASLPHTGPRPEIPKNDTIYDPRKTGDVDFVYQLYGEQDAVMAVRDRMLLENKLVVAAVHAAVGMLGLSNTEAVERSGTFYLKPPLEDVSTANSIHFAIAKAIEIAGDYRYPDTIPT